MKTALSEVALILFILFLSWTSDSGESSVGSGYYNDEYAPEYEEEEDLVTSDNWDCTEDCSGHDAGYEWASENGIRDPLDCGGNSDSFIEGCEAYANEQTFENEQEYEEEYDYPGY